MISGRNSNSNNQEYSQTCKYPFDWVLAYLQVLGDPGQGWANAILYIFFTKVIRERIWESIKRIFYRFCKIPGRKIQDNEREKLVNEKENRLSYY